MIFQNESLNQMFPDLESLVDHYLDLIPSVDRSAVKALSSLLTAEEKKTVFNELDVIFAYDYDESVEGGSAEDLRKACFLE